MTDSPDSPREWSLDHPSLASKAAHEGSAVIRMHRAGHRSQAILDLFRMRGTQLIKQLEVDARLEQIAASDGRPIHDGLMPKEETS